MHRGDRKNVFVVGLDDWHLEQLRTIRNADDYAFHPLLAFDEVVNPASYEIERLIEEGYATLDAFDGPVDAIVGHWDFPTTTLLPLFRAHAGLRGATLQSVMRCEHKWLSRVHQQRVAAESVPPFQAFDPFAPDPWHELEIGCPFWMKPIKAFSSYLGFRVHSERDFRRDLEAVRKGIWLMAEPFDHLLGLADLGDETGGIDGHHCIAEEIIGGHQCTLEGYVQAGTPHVYGIIDSFRGRNRSSFERYEYPSRMPHAVQERMVSVFGRVARDIGYDDAPLNMEFFHDRHHDRLWILEVNPRMSKSHCALFELVAGASHHEVAIEVALGVEPRFPVQAGAWRRAAKFMVREYRDARVVQAPDEERLRSIERELGGVRIQVHVEAGMRLSELPPQDQDSYSYETAVIFVGADTRDELHRKYEAALERLDLRYED